MFRILFAILVSASFQAAAVGSPPEAGPQFSSSYDEIVWDCSQREPSDTKAYISCIVNEWNKSLVLTISSTAFTQLKKLGVPQDSISAADVLKAVGLNSWFDARRACQDATNYEKCMDGKHSEFVLQAAAAIIAQYQHGKGHVSPSAPQFTEQDQRIIEQIQGEMDRLPYTEYAGYPLCSEIWTRRQQERLRIFEAFTADYFAELRDEMREELKAIEERYGAAAKSAGLKFNWNVDELLKSSLLLRPNDLGSPEKPLAEIQASSDAPEHYKYTEYARPIPVVYCFEGSTPVLRLMRKCLFENCHVTDGDDLARPEDALVEQTTIDDIYAGEFVLASTVEVIKDPRYHKDCWAQVEGRQVGELRDWDGERFKKIEFKSSKSNDTFTVQVTPRHRFFAMTESDGEWYWLQAGAEKFQPGISVLSDCKGGSCRVRSVGESAAPGRGRAILKKVFHRNHYPLVHNLMVPGVHTYYVGPSVDKKVLVHNIK